MSSENKSAFWVSTSRLETLCDGVFAIAMTLLVLEMSLPEGFDSEISAFREVLRGRLYNFISFVSSFLIISVFWIIHHEQFKYIKKTDLQLLLINILTMMFVALIPITTGIMNIFKNLSAAQMLFDGNILIVGILCLANWVYAASGGKLTEEQLPAELISRVRTKSLLVAGISSAAMVLSLFFQYWGDLAYILLPLLLWLVPGRGGRSSSNQ